MTPPTKSLTSDDALSRSLDVIDALAYLPVLLAAQSQADSAEVDVGNASFSSEAIEDLLDAIANALETGDTEGLRKTLEENKSLQDLLSKQGTSAAWLMSGEGRDSSDPAANAGRASNSVSNAIASLIAALDAVNGGASAESTQSTRKDGTAEISEWLNGEHTAPGEKSEKEGAEGATSAAGSDDVARSAMLLGAVLPNLLAKSDTAAENFAATEASSTETSSELISFLAQQKASQGMGTKTNGAASRTGSSKGENQQDGTNSLSEDQVFLGTAKTDRTSDTVSSSETIFEVLYTRAENNSDAGKTTAEASAPLTGNIQGEGRHTATPGDVPAKQTVQAPAHVLEKQPEDGKTGSPAAKTVLTEEAVFADMKSRKEKSSHSDDSAGPSDTNEKANVLIHDSTKATTSSQKSGQTGQAAASQASAMVHKIEELAESYSSKNQSMDMVLRLKVDEKESLVVGLRSQGDRVLVDVKGASDGLLSALQSQKDLITRELESKQIYTTINVEINGDGNPSQQDRRQRQDRNGKENNEADFGGIFNTLT